MAFRETRTPLARMHLPPLSVICACTPISLNLRGEHPPHKHIPSQLVKNIHIQKHETFVTESQDNEFILKAQTLIYNLKNRYYLAYTASKIAKTLKRQ